MSTPFACPTTTSVPESVEQLQHMLKEKRPASLDRAYSFQFIAIETSGSDGLSTMSFLRVLGHRLKTNTGEPQSLVFLLQRLSVAIQTGNAISVFGSLVLDKKQGAVLKMYKIFGMARECFISTMASWPSKTWSLDPRVLRLWIFLRIAEERI